MRTFKLVLIAFALSIGASPALAQDAPRPMTVDDDLAMVTVGSPLVSPDGTWVLYSKRTLNWDDNEYETEYWRVPTSGGEGYRYIGEEGGSGFQFSPNGTYLSFRRSVGEGSASKQQIFLMRSSGGEAVQLTKHPTSIGSFQWAEDESQIFFQADNEKPDSVAAEEKKGADAIFVDEGPNGQTVDQWQNLWAFDMASDSARQITDGEFLLGSWDVSPDGQQVVMTARFRNRRNDADQNEIYIASVADGELRQLTDNNAPEGGVSWAPDGSQFMYTAADDQEWMNRNTKFWIMNPETGDHRLLTGNFEGSPGDPTWTPDSRRILFSGQQRTNTNLFSIDVSSGDIEQLTNVSGTLSPGSFSKDRSVYAYTFSDYRTPADVWVGRRDGVDPLKLTDANPQVSEWLLADMQVIDWESVNDFTIEGLLHLPPERQDDEVVPLMLNIHGGPAGVFSNSWRASYHIHAGLGYASLSPNVRGSRSYTDRLREGNTVQQGDGIGFGDYQDLMRGVDKLIEDGIADPDRMGVKGWSYGGILGGWTITQTDRFKAASLGAGVFDWTSEYGPGFNNDVRLWHIGGTPWSNPDAWRNQSALTHVDNVTTPTLLIHGINDTTDTEQQSMMFYAAIRDIGKAPVRYMRFPREPHGFREPRHQRIRDVEEIRWMQLHVLGEEWTPWARPAKPKTPPPIT